MKKLLNLRCTLLVLLSFVAFQTVKAQDNVIDEVVWIIGDEAILKSEVEEARMNAIYEGRRFDRDP